MGVDSLTPSALTPDSTIALHALESCTLQAWDRLTPACALFAFFFRVIPTHPPTDIPKNQNYVAMELYKQPLKRAAEEI
eukprot:scaffold22353_cov18-Tisochrysis_lutea.AAC.4